MSTHPFGVSDLLSWSSTRKTVYNKHYLWKVTDHIYLWIFLNLCCKMCFSWHFNIRLFCNLSCSFQALWHTCMHPLSSKQYVLLLGLQSFGCLYWRQSSCRLYRPSLRQSLPVPNPCWRFVMDNSLISQDQWLAKVYLSYSFFCRCRFSELLFSEIGSPHAVLFLNSCPKLIVWVAAYKIIKGKCFCYCSSQTFLFFFNLNGRWTYSFGIFNINPVRHH